MLLKPENAHNKLLDADECKNHKDTTSISSSLPSHLKLLKTDLLLTSQTCQHSEAQTTTAAQRLVNQFQVHHYTVGPAADAAADHADADHALQANLHAADASDASRLDA
jgi:hypothetical protein